MSKTVSALGTESATAPFKKITIERRDLRPDDIEMEVLYCGICHSDLHVRKNDFGNTRYPLVPGHEILGRVTAVGSDVTRFKVGDLSAVGCIVDSCGECEPCRHDMEMFCEEGMTLSFNDHDKFIDEDTNGGFSKSYVVRENYAVKVPEALNRPEAAPLLCAGITVYSPLKHWNAGPGKKVGILGIGGLGHVAIRMAQAMGAHVVVLTHSPDKVDDAKRLGAHEAVLTSDPEQMKAWAGKLDLVLDTVSAKHDVNQYLNLLAIDGSVVLVGLPNEPLEVGAFNIVNGRHSFSGSNIGGIAETEEMMQFSAEHNIFADVELVQPDQVTEAFERLEKGDVKYRFVIDMSKL